MSAAASIVSRDSAAESTHSSIIGAKASKLKSKLKSKLHRKHDGDHEDGDEDDGDEYDEDEPELGEGGVVRVRSRASEVGVDGGPTMQAATPAQAYAAANTPHVGDGVAATDYVSPANAAGSRVSASYTGAPGTPGRGESRTHLDGSLTSHGEVSYRDRSKSSSSATLPATQSNWKREAEFHNLFEGIDEDEQLVSDYSSAWAKDILRHGRLYVGAVHLAFSCGIIGLKATLVLAWTDITKIEKTVTARVIPNAILITNSANETFLFSSFAYRDTSYDLLLDCWKASNPSAHDAFLSAQLAEHEASLAASETSSPATIDLSSPRNPTSNDDEGAKKGVAFAPEGSGPVTAHAPHAATECHGAHYKETALDVRFPSEPEKIYNLLYRDDKFMTQFCAAQNLTDLKISEWTPPTGGLGKRTLSYVKPLSGSVGPSSATCQIAEEELHTDADKSYELLAITKTPEVPSGGSFQVETKTCLTWAGGAKGGCRMLVTTECVWKGRSMIKGIVTSASIAGQRAYNKELAKAIRAHIHQHAAEFGSGDTTAPEADDELSPAEPGSTSSEGPAGGSASGKAGALDELLGAVGLSTTTLLLLSNLVLFLVVIALWRRVGRAGSAVKVAQTVMSRESEEAALARLVALEARWSEFRKCVDGLDRALSRQ